MKRRVEEWTVARLYKERDQISFPEYQREKSLWPTEKKAKLIDSILLDIDIPKLYFNKVSKNIEVVDGQQRLWSIWEFLDNAYRYAADGGGPRFYSDLTTDQKQTIQRYIFQVTVFDDADDDYLRELFVRLQLGLLLNTGEKLHASTGKMKDLIFSDLAAHDFIRTISIPSRRFAKETLCAQIAINVFTRDKLNAFARTRYEDLSHFFEQYQAPHGKDQQFFNEEVQRIHDVLARLRSCFRDGATNLRNRSYILSIYLLLDELVGSNRKHELTTKDQK
ncbi:MAG: DUF262 domain-containing protein, partial [Ktedonobacteraceae bacterium]